MDKMKAPERIWTAAPGAKGTFCGRIGTWVESPDHTSPRTEYVRGDIHAALTAERDAIAARVKALETEPVAIKPAKYFSEFVAESAVTWCGEKGRETFPEDIAYFKQNWSSMPGMWPYVIRAALTGAAS